MKQAAERKSDGALKSGALEQTVKLFQNAMSMPLSPQVQEEALFDLVRVPLPKHCLNVHWGDVRDMCIGFPTSRVKCLYLGQCNFLFVWWWVMLAERVCFQLN